MIRDPSDGSVREKSDERRTIYPIDGRRANDPNSAGLVRERSSSEKTGAGEIASGLPFGSTNPENLARIERSREWMKLYRKGEAWRR